MKLRIALFTLYSVYFACGCVEREPAQKFSITESPTCRGQQRETLNDTAEYDKTVRIARAIQLENSSQEAKFLANMEETSLLQITDVVEWGSTKVWAAKCCHMFVDSLRGSILTLEAAEKNDGNQISNIGGWQSKPEILERSDFGMRQVRDTVYQLLAKYMDRVVPQGAGGTIDANVKNAWANVNRLADMNRPHLHDAFLSGVFYLDYGGTYNESQICWHDPRPQVRNAWIKWMGKGWIQDETMTICRAPQPGLLILFPAWLEHYVAPLRSDTERVSIAFNVKISFPNHSPQDGNRRPLQLRLPPHHGGSSITIRPRI